MDIWNKEKRSNVMSKIKSTNTRPELLLRKFLFAKGMRYRINYKKLPGKPDIVFPKYKLIVFVNGCFWHGHEACKIAHIPKTNTEFWKHKIDKNIERDYKNVQDNILLGWNVIVIWECEINRKNLDNVYNRILNVISEDLENRAFKIKLYEENKKAILKIGEDILTLTNNDYNL